MKKILVILLLLALTLVGLNYFGGYRWTNDDFKLIYQANGIREELIDDQLYKNDRAFSRIRQNFDEWGRPKSLTHFVEQGEKIKKSFNEVYQQLRDLEEQIMFSTGGLDPETGQLLNPARVGNTGEYEMYVFDQTINELGILITEVSNEKERVVEVEKAASELVTSIETAPVSIALTRLAVFEIRLSRLEYSLLIQTQMGLKIGISELSWYGNH